MRSLRRGWEVGRVGRDRWARIYSFAMGRVRRILEYRRFLHRRFQRGEAFLDKTDTPAKLFFRWQLGLSNGIMKLASSQNPSYPNLSRNVRETSNQHHRNSLFLDFFSNRSAATCARPSRRG